MGVGEGCAGAQTETHLSAMTTLCFLSALTTFLMNIGAGFLACMSSLWTWPNPKSYAKATAIVVLPVSTEHKRQNSATKHKIRP